MTTSENKPPFIPQNRFMSMVAGEKTGQNVWWPETQLLRRLGIVKAVKSNGVRIYHPDDMPDPLDVNFVNSSIIDNDHDALKALRLVIKELTADKEARYEVTQAFAPSRRYMSERDRKVNKESLPIDELISYYRSKSDLYSKDVAPEETERFMSVPRPVTESYFVDPRVVTDKIITQEMVLNKLKQVRAGLVPEEQLAPVFELPEDPVATGVQSLRKAGYKMAGERLRDQRDRSGLSPEVVIEPILTVARERLEQDPTNEAFEAELNAACEGRSDWIRAVEAGELFISRPMMECIVLGVKTVNPVARRGSKHMNVEDMYININLDPEKLNQAKEKVRRHLRTSKGELDYSGMAKYNDLSPGHMRALLDDNINPRERRGIMKREVIEGLGNYMRVELSKMEEDVAQFETDFDGLREVVNHQHTKRAETLFRKNLGLAIAI